MSWEDRRGAALAVAAAAGAELLVCADPANVHWLTGVAAEIETGPSPFAPPPLLVLAADAPPLLIAAEGDVATPAPDIELRTYVGFGNGPLDGPARAQALVGDAVAGRGAAIDSLLARAMLAGDGARLLDASDALCAARAVKDAAALAQIRAAIAVADAGQARLRAAAVAGADELELFAAARGAMEARAGARVPLSADLLSGSRGAAMGGAPSARRVRAGELVLCDLAPRVGGTWGDSCATVAVGEPTAAARAAHRRVAEALERTIEAVRPGVPAAELDALARAGLDYPHHTGHGIGSAFYEAPRIVPDAPERLREGMVLALEPAAYTDDFGIRLEHVVRVTADGCEVLSAHALEL